MNPETLFSIANAVALVGWIILALAPLRRPLAIGAARTIGVVLAVAYSTLLIRSLTGGGFEGDLTTLAGLTAAFSRREAVLVGWVHYLAFDLWVGAWATEDAGKRSVPHWALVPCLFFILMAGPFGLLLYLATRTILGRKAAG